VSPAAIETALKTKKYKILTFTHVDTSTGVLSDAKEITEIVKRVSPETLVVLDGVCSVASEEIQMDKWGIDVVMTASQKGLGIPPGLSILVASKNAIKVCRTCFLFLSYISFDYCIGFREPFNSSYIILRLLEKVYIYHFK
jgi:alanine-glyoxylate transaminase / serine-glyoxylate transaminase / serine-pyruvate transaminase